jgi:hypothetical protein
MDARPAQEQEALLPSTAVKNGSNKSLINIQSWLSPSTRSEHRYIQTSREKVKRFLSSKTGHYSVLGLVVLDVACIFAGVLQAKGYLCISRVSLFQDFIINLFKCEKQWGDEGWDEALEGLSIVSLVFSSLFMLELVASIWAWGWEYDRP